MKKVVLGLLMLASAGVECMAIEDMKLSQCERDVRARNALLCGLIDAAPNVTVRQAVGAVSSIAGGASAAGTSSTSSSTPVSTGVAGDMPADMFDALRDFQERLKRAADERSKALKECDDLKVKASTLEEDITRINKELDSSKKQEAALSAEVGKLKSENAKARSAVADAIKEQDSARREGEEAKRGLQQLKRKLSLHGFDESCGNLPKRAEIEKALIGAKALKERGYGEDGAGLPAESKDDVKKALIGAKALKERGYKVDGEGLPTVNMKAVKFALDLLGKFGIPTDSELLLSYGVDFWRAVLASGLDLGTEGLLDPEDEVNTTNFENDEAVQQLPKEMTAEQLQADDAMKFMLLRGFFGIRRGSYDQEALNDFKVKVKVRHDGEEEDGEDDIPLGDDGLELKVE